jgi:hypothetical protein
MFSMCLAFRLYFNDMWKYFNFVDISYCYFFTYVLYYSVMFMSDWSQELGWELELLDSLTYSL